MSLEGRVAIVTGSGGGLGRAQLAQIRPEAGLELGAQRQQAGLPFPVVVNTVPAPVVQFVADERANCMPRPYGSASQSGTSIGRACSAGLPR